MGPVVNGKMNANMRPKHVTLCILLVIFLAGSVWLTREIFFERFGGHVWLCTHFPQAANYSESFPLNDESIDLVLSKDHYVYKEFTDSFSEPIRVTISETMGIKCLRRVWKTNRGFLVLNTDQDPRAYGIYISYTEEDGSLTDIPCGDKATEMTTVTKRFLSDY